MILVELVQVGPIVVHGHVLVLLHAIPHTCEREVDCTVLTISKLAIPFLVAVINRPNDHGHHRFAIRFVCFAC